MSGLDNVNQAFGLAIGKASFTEPIGEKWRSFESLSINGSRKNGSRENHLRRAR
jgi:hypothetical protein